MKISHKNIFKEIQEITEKLISLGLSVEQNFPSCCSMGNKIYEISYAGMIDLSIALKDIKYQEIYAELDKNKNYNIKMIDGALIQMLYTYQDSTLISHRLAFFPSPDLESFQNEPEIYENDEIYADILAKNIMVIPIRFDYDPDNFKELEHPKCHLTLGQFKNCRIPVCSPLTPNVFISFILNSFYNTASKKFSQNLNLNKVLFDETITKLEKERLHIAIL